MKEFVDFLSKLSKKKKGRENPASFESFDFDKPIVFVRSKKKVKIVSRKQKKSNFVSFSFCLFLSSDSIIIEEKNYE